jgi:hypothetical protein
MEDNEDAGKPLGTAEDLGNLLFPNLSNRMSKGFDELQDVLKTMLSSAGSNSDAAVAAVRELLISPATIAELRETLLTAIRGCYSPEQIDTLVGFYTSNPWAVECTERMSDNLGRLLEPLQKKLCDQLMARLPEILDMDGPEFPSPDSESWE